MDEATLKIPQDQLNAVAAAAILKLMDDQTKGDIIAQAIAHLTKESRYGESLLYAAFNTAVSQCAEAAVRDVVENSEKFSAAVRDLAIEALDNWLAAADGEMKKEAAKGILAAMTKIQKY